MTRTEEIRTEMVRKFGNEAILKLERAAVVQAVDDRRAGRSARYPETEHVASVIYLEAFRIIQID